MKMSVQLQAWSESKRGYYCVHGSVIHGTPTAQMRLLGVVNSRGEAFHTHGFGLPKCGPPLLVIVHYRHEEDAAILNEYFRSATTAEFEEILRDQTPTRTPSTGPQP